VDRDTIGCYHTFLHQSLNRQISSAKVLEISFSELIFPLVFGSSQIGKKETSETRTFRLCGFMWLRSYHLAGLIGISVYLPLITYVISEIKPIVSIRDRKNKFFNYKVSFHVIFFIASFSESFYSLSMLILNRYENCGVWYLSVIEIRVTVWGYVFRIFSLLLTVVYFSMV
jgi:hypothetical protein